MLAVATADLARARPPAGELVCAACERRISHADYRIEVAGAHAHTCVNPDGFVHHLGCFAVATGLAYLGPTETGFSWFPGFTWQLAHCATCDRHLGWIYRCAGESFHGLVLDRLRARPDRAA